MEGAFTDFGRALGVWYQGQQVADFDIAFIYKRNIHCTIDYISKFSSAEIWYWITLEKTSARLIVHNGHYYNGLP